MSRLLGYCTIIVFLIIYAIEARSHHRHNHNHTNINANDTLERSNNTIKSLKLTLVSSYPNGHGIFNNINLNRWHAKENDQKEAEKTWRAASVTGAVTATTTRSLQDRVYTKHHAGRNICIEHKTISMPVNTHEIYNMPPNFKEPCYNQQLCNSFRNRQMDVLRHRTTKHIVHNCCPGWAQLSKTSHGCTKPICTYPCKNGGKCVKPDTCSCTQGFIGKYCEFDRNECQEDKPCDQTCYNTEGSYYCTCRDGFQLQSDKQSCKKISHINTAFEARDLENDVDYEDINLKISKIEKLIGTEKEFNNEIQRKIQNTAATMNHFKMRIENMEHRQQELVYIKEKLNTQEMQARKLEYIVDLLYKCQTKHSIFCPLQR